MSNYDRVIPDYETILREYYRKCKDLEARHLGYAFAAEAVKLDTDTAKELLSHPLVHVEAEGQDTEDPETHMEPEDIEELRDLGFICVEPKVKE